MKVISLLFAALILIGFASKANADDSKWQYQGTMSILTTPAGANLPSTVREKNFPLLVRLDKDWFNFKQAKPRGEDIRFEDKEGKPLAYQIDQWDAVAGTASIWVRIPLIMGNSRQSITLRWGNPLAQSKSDGSAVFNASNGYIGVWHLGDHTQDVVGRIASEDKGTRKAAGMIGGARHFPGKAGIRCGTDINVLPQGGAGHSTQAWFRSSGSKGRVVAWGNEKRAGKVTMDYGSPPRIRMDCYFSNGTVQAEIPNRATGWVHAVHTFESGRATLYLNGQKQGEGNPRHTSMELERPARMWIGGWYENFDFTGEIDEVRVSDVARSADWVRLEYENQKRMQTLVGPLVQPGNTFAVTPTKVAVRESETVNFSAQAGGAEKIYWTLIKDDQETVVATDRFQFSFDTGRISGDQLLSMRFDAVYAGELRSIQIPISIKENLPEPQFVLKAPAIWDGRETVGIQPEITNLEALQKAGVDQLNYSWEVDGLATDMDARPGRLLLHRAQNSGSLIVKLSLENGGDKVTASTKLMVQEPPSDAWVPRVSDATEMPLEGQFYARDGTGFGSLQCKGILQEPVDEVFLRVFADDKKFADVSRQPDPRNAYDFSINLKPGMITYRIEFGTKIAGTETVLYKAGDMLCGDAYLINGQSNALATDTREESPRVKNPWVRSYGRPRFFKKTERENLWCKPVWKAQNKENKEYLAELGWWGMELAEHLVKTHKVPVFFVNGAVGGTRIDQHQRHDENPTDLETIYGRMLWRVKEAGLTHGIRAIIWHQGENDQGAAGPDGGYGWETYQRYFINMSADWKRDFPNVSRYYVFQIWPNACSMGSGVSGDMLREKQRTLPSLYSNMEILSTLGIEPGGTCHFPLEGWSVFAKRVGALVGRDFFQQPAVKTISPANLTRVYYSQPERDEITLEFDQEMSFEVETAGHLYLDGEKAQVTAGRVSGNLIILKLSEHSNAERITYLEGKRWANSVPLLRGNNGIAALTFCNVPILNPRKDQ